MKTLEYNIVDITIQYATAHEADLVKVYSTPFNPDTGVQQYLDYYSEGFIHDHPEAIEMELISIKAYNNEEPDDSSEIYQSDGNHRWVKGQ